MTIRLTNVAAGALLAAAVLGGAAAGAETESAPVGSVNTENGVHAVPSGHVIPETLPLIGRAGAPARSSQPVRKLAHASAPAPRLKVQLASTTPVRAPVREDALTPADSAGLPATRAPSVRQSRTADVLFARDDSPVAVRESPVDFEPAAEVEFQPLALASLDQVAPADLLEPVDYASEEPMQPSSAEAIDEPASMAPAREDPGMRQHIAFPRHSAEAASAFARYVRAVDGLGPRLKDAPSVGSALQAAAAYDSAQLEEGMIAYGAIAALQASRFVYGVMDAAAEEGSRRDLIEALLSDPAAASRLPGAEEAAGLADAAILGRARPLLASGRALKQASYDLQHQPWSLVSVSDPQGRLARAKALSSERIAARDEDIADLLGQVAGSPGPDRREVAGSPFTQVSVRSLALAALSILDGAKDEARLQPVTTERAGAQCLKMAKLNLFQCLSVAGPEYEDVYCLGQHAVLDTGQCVASAAAPLSPLLQAALPRESRSVMISAPPMSSPDGIR